MNDCRSATLVNEAQFGTRRRLTLVRGKEDVLTSLEDIRRSRHKSVGTTSAALRSPCYKVSASSKAPPVGAVIAFLRVVWANAHRVE